MKLIVRFSAYLFLLVPLILASPAFAKGPVDKITITGPGLTDTIEITDPKILAFDPWGGTFIDWRRGILAQPPLIDQAYPVFFSLKNSEGRLQVIYALQYYPDPSGQGGYVYLPGPEDQWYRVNIGTIMRSESDGKWHYASGEWNTVMLRLLKEHGVSPTADTSLAATIRQNPCVIPLIDSGIIGSVALWILLRLRLKPA